MNNVLKKSPIREHQVVGEIIDDIQVCMITTRGENGRLVGRPMQVQEVDQDNCLWFFTSADTMIVEEILSNPDVGVTFSSKAKNEHLSISGRGEKVDDRQKMKDLWNPALKAWFKDGLETPGITLLRISIDEAEYWDAPSSPVVKIGGFLKALITDEPFNPAENARVEIRH